MQFIRLAGHHLGLGGYLTVRQDLKHFRFGCQAMAEIKDFSLET